MKIKVEVIIESIFAIIALKYGEASPVTKEAVEKLKQNRKFDQFIIQVQSLLVNSRATSSPNDLVKQFCRLYVDLFFSLDNKSVIKTIYKAKDFAQYNREIKKIASIATEMQDQLITYNKYFFEWDGGDKFRVHDYLHRPFSIMNIVLGDNAMQDLKQIFEEIVKKVNQAMVISEHAKASVFHKGPRRTVACFETEGLFQFFASQLIGQKVKIEPFNWALFEKVSKKQVVNATAARFMVHAYLACGKSIHEKTVKKIVEDVSKNKVSIYY